MPRRPRLTTSAMPWGQSGHRTSQPTTGFAEAVERAAASRLMIVRAAARVELSIDALLVPPLRRLREQVSRLPLFTEAASFSSQSILRKGLLAYSAALMAIGVAVVASIVPGLSATNLAARRSGLAAASASVAGPGGANGPDLHGAGPFSLISPPNPNTAGGAFSAPATTPLPATPPTTQPPLPPPTYVNPLARVGNLQPKRIDEGVDYAGAGPLLALGSGVIRVTSEGGWPGGTFIALQLDKGQLAGRIIYYAENVTPTVRVGQHVNAGDVVGVLHDAYPNLEIGWGGGGTMGGTIGDALARSNGGDREGVSTAVGVNFNQVLVLLGAPGGIQQGLMGRFPAS